jgi:SAM-dependent methyltransferase
MFINELISNHCLICHSKKVYYSFSINQYRVEECSNCGLMRLNPQPSDGELAKIYSTDYFLMQENSHSISHVSALKSNTADRYLDLLEAYVRAPLQGSLLEIGYGNGDFLVRAAARGLAVTGIEQSPHAMKTTIDKLGSQGRVICGEMTQLLESEERFDYIVLSDVLEHVRNPREFLRIVRLLLRENGIVMIAVPSLDSFSVRLMKDKWIEFKPEHLWYFSRITLRQLLYSEDFKAVKVGPAKKTLSLEYIIEHFKRYPVKFFSNILILLEQWLPHSLRTYSFPIVASGILVFAGRAEDRPVKKLSVVMAAYNEEKTIRFVLERILAKKINNLEIEIIIVESKSTDKTGDIVREYEGRDRVKIIWQDQPRGKGNAIRAGLEHISGDFVLIQDADDEYDIEDYDVLVEPLIAGEAAFVLGARHGGRTFKMRRFSGQPVVGHLLNLGHWFFTLLVNVFFGLKLKDPFTMYKVFRADCLRHLKFECDHFDFDYELLLKLVRSGYRPIEIPINYRSRSFKEGKKIRVIRDPLNWLQAIIRLRLQKI